MITQPLQASDLQLFSKTETGRHRGPDMAKPPRQGVARGLEWERYGLMRRGVASSRTAASSRYRVPSISSAVSSPRLIIAVTRCG